MSEILRILVAASKDGDYLIRPRDFVTDYRDELRQTSDATVSLAVHIESLAAKSKAVTVAERSAFTSLVGLLSDQLGSTLKSNAPLAKPPTPAPIIPEGARITRCPTPDPETNKLPKDARDAKARGRPKGSGETVDVPRASIHLPPVKVDIIAPDHLAAARMAFFADARRVECTQAALSEKATQTPIDARYWSGVFKDGEGLDPRDVIRTHRNVIGSTPMGLQLLTHYEHHLIGADRCVDVARRILAVEHKGGPLGGISVDDWEKRTRHWNAYPPQGTCTAEDREARKIAEVIANTPALVRDGQTWKAIPPKEVVAYTRKGMRISYVNGKSSADTHD